MINLNELKDDISIVIPVFREYHGLQLLLESLHSNSFQQYKIILLVPEYDNLVDLILNKYARFDIEIFIENEPQLELRLYKFFGNKSNYKYSVVIHTDVEIIDFDPIDEIYALGRQLDNVGLIGVERHGGFLLPKGYHPPTISSHFLYINNYHFAPICRDVLEEGCLAQPGASLYQTDVFPARGVQLLHYYKLATLSLPSSILSKIYHYNSSTRKKTFEKTFSEISNSSRDEQIDISAGVISQKLKSHKLKKKSLENVKTFFIIGLGEDATTTLKQITNFVPKVNIKFVDTSPLIASACHMGYPVINFSKLDYDSKNDLIYISVPTYDLWAKKLILSGLSYQFDFRIRVNYGHEYFGSNEDLTYILPNDASVYIVGKQIYRNSLNSIDGQLISLLRFRNISLFVLATFLVYVGNAPRQANLILIRGHSYIRKVISKFFPK